jgi:hypothetical protein
MPLRILTLCGAQRAHKAGPTGPGGLVAIRCRRFGMKPSILPTFSRNRLRGFGGFFAGKNFDA